MHYNQDIFQSPTSFSIASADKDSSINTQIAWKVASFCPMNTKKITQKMTPKKKFSKKTHKQWQE